MEKIQEKDPVDFLKKFVGLVKVIRLYPPTHKAVQRAAETAVLATRELLASAGEGIFALQEKACLYNDQPLPQENRMVAEMKEMMYRHRLRAVRLSEAVRPRDILRLALVLGEEPQKLRGQGGAIATLSGQGVSGIKVEEFYYDVRGDFLRHREDPGEEAPKPTEVFEGLQDDPEMALRLESIQRRLAGRARADQDEVQELDLRELVFQGMSPTEKEKLLGDKDALRRAVAGVLDLLEGLVAEPGRRSGRKLEDVVGQEIGRDLAAAGAGPAAPAAEGEAGDGLKGLFAKDRYAHLRSDAPRAVPAAGTEEVLRKREDLGHAVDQGELEAIKSRLEAVDFSPAEFYRSLRGDYRFISLEILLELLVDEQDPERWEQLFEKVRQVLFPGREKEEGEGEEAEGESEASPLAGGQLIPILERICAMRRFSPLLKEKIAIILIEIAERYGLGELVEEFIRSSADPSHAIFFAEILPLLGERADHYLFSRLFPETGPPPAAPPAPAKEAAGEEGQGEGEAAPAAAPAALTELDDETWRRMLVTFLRFAKGGPRVFAAAWSRIREARRQRVLEVLEQNPEDWTIPCLAPYLAGPAAVRQRVLKALARIPREEAALLMLGLVGRENQQTNEWIIKTAGEYSFPGVVEGLGQIVLWRDLFNRRLRLRLLALMALERISPDTLIPFVKKLRQRKRLLFLGEAKEVLRAIDGILARAEAKLREAKTTKLKREETEGKPGKNGRA